MLFFNNKKIIPVPDEPQPNPCIDASWLSKITYSWENKIFKVGFNRPLQNNDLYQLDPRFKEEFNEKRFYHFWNEDKITQDDKGSVVKTLGKVFGKKYMLAGVLKLISDIANLLSPVILELLLDYLESGEEEEDSQQIQDPNYDPNSLMSMINKNKGWIYVGSIFLLQLIYTVCSNYYSKMVLEVGFSVRATLIGIIYRKTLRLSNKEMQTIGEGKILNMAYSDTYRIQHLLANLHYLWSSPLQLFIILILLVRSLGVWSFIGFSSFLFIVPFQAYIMRVLVNLRKKTVVLTDERVKKTQEILGNIRIIKFFGWEKSFEHIINELRKNELKFTKKSIITNAETTAVFNVIPFFSSALTFIAYCAAGNPLTAAKVFSCHALFNKLCFPLSNLSSTFNQLTSGLVGMKRVTRLMNGEELDDLVQIDPSANFGVFVKNGQFNWETVKPDDIRLKPKKNKKQKRRERKLLHFNRKKQQKKQDRIKKLKRYSRIGGEDIVNDSVDDLMGNNNLVNKADDGEDLNLSESTDALNINGGIGNLDIKNLESFKLRDINLRIKKHSLTAIVGAVGSGKSSLVNAIIGEMKRESGKIIIGGKYSYCSQKAWIRNATVRENILLGKPYNKERYDKAVENCALLRDFDIFSNGDMTELGERGANLSGGQKQRINLARAVYEDSDVIFMDDPLSAVDAHVSRFLFEKCITGVLAGKTRILVTHQLHLLPKVDYVVVMNNGRIEEQGEYKELMQKDGELARLMRAYGDTENENENDNENESESESDNMESPSITNTVSISNTSDITASEEKESSNKEENKNKKKKVQGIMTQEERATGSVKWSIYKNYIKSGGGYVIGIFVLFLVGLIQFAKLGSDMWLVYWTEHTFKSISENNYILIYLAWNAGQTLITFFYYVYMANVGIKAAKTIHIKAISNVMKAPVLFFDSNPLGRIINRFSMDQDALDNSLFLSIQVLFTSLASSISTLALMIYAAPILGVAVIPLLFIYLYIQQLFRCTSRELKRMDALARSPLLAHMSETMAGLPTIRTYHEEEHLIRHNQFLIDENNRPIHLQSIAKKWLSFRLEIIGAILVLLDGVAGLLLKDTLSVSLLGLSLSYALQVTNNLNATVRNFCNTEVYMNSAERLLHYSDEIDIEKQDGKEAPVAWPSGGKIEMRNVTMRYAPYLPPTLRDVNLNINSHEKVGIVGRTGAGKSSIIMTLFRLVEPEIYSTIRIDDVSITDMKLSNLRKGISIIPQEPILFSGTIRFNMDPFNEHSDSEIWYALENSGLKPLIMDMDKGLESEVRTNGENFSVGQRQLLCLARAMIRHSHILIMDEATASCDIETDNIIQKALRTNFNDATVLTIAHRLNTIIDYDKILVLDKGEVLEYDSPKNLLFETDENGELIPTTKTEFSKLVDETGPANAEMLKQMALSGRF
ncbi:P-loop containing nucleoside triphosphate hydrolase protein [Anaeromyces robustus]|uniref:p-loop containing nucleoside triphosphate hydrolase protein n=1 Tax=Anaeromyces robustus TaxID=1754192 RepID=A0A1Y1X2E7_9FUNG|nr:P-loop containing nucleoside triphosphate hydrolase protein [Anaeromyces robustus]|eukprot:ORX79967.1 P-loop containing nucleoside triphosphate hydrolase protein [Anaeromyces robustus]